MKAYMWLSMAQKAGSKEATRNMEIVGQSLTKQQKIQASSAVHFSFEG
jgi:hypothetical protein